MNTSQKSTKLLCILDGFGITDKTANNILKQSNLPTLKKAFEIYPWILLQADGEFVGQENGLVGNSEVGHMNLGGLQLVKQLSYQITKSAELDFDLSKEYSEQLCDPTSILSTTYQQVLQPKCIHLIGLFSTGTIHSDLRHWAGAIASAGRAGADKIILHIISDGRDSDRQSLLQTWGYFVDNFKSRLNPFKDLLELGSVGGRFYAMDRDTNWDRVTKGLRVMVGDNIANAESKTTESIYPRPEDNKLNTELDSWQRISEQLEAVVELNYKADIYDEMIEPLSFRTVEKSEVVWLINFRTDRFRQLTELLCDINLDLKLDLKIISLNDYGIIKYPSRKIDNNMLVSSGGYYPIFKNVPVTQTLADYIANSNLSQLHIAETEKYNHVTYFFNGGQNVRHPGEVWKLINSNKVNSHASSPDMKAREITDYIIEEALGKYDYIIVNYANPDMLGHTGNTAACIQSMEFLDNQLRKLFDAVVTGGHTMVLTSDHGNIEKVGSYTENGKTLIDTEHNPNPVPCLIVSKKIDYTSISRYFGSHNHQLLVPSIQAIEDLQRKKDNPLDSDYVQDEKSLNMSFPLWYAGFILLSLGQ